MIADISPIEVKLSVGLVADLTGKGDDRRNLPVKTGSGSNLAIRYHCMVELGHTVRVAKCIVGSEGGFRDSGPGIKRHITVELVLQARRWHHSIQQPLWPQFPANTCGGNHWVFPLDIDTYSKDKLHVRTENVGATDDKRHVEIVPKQMTET